MEKKTRKRMSNKAFNTIWGTVVALLLILCVAVNIAAGMFSGVLDSYLGGGEMTVTQIEGSENWDSVYNAAETASLQEAKEKSDLVSEQVTDEGIVLLKNNGLLPLKENSKLTPIGYGYMNPSYSGTGAAASKDDTMITAVQGLAAHFMLNNAAVKKMEAGTAVSPDAAPDAPALDFDKSSLQANSSGKAAMLWEYPLSTYAGIEKEIQGTTGIVFIRRTGSEGFDKRFYAYDDGTPHYLALSVQEKELIRYTKENCGSVVVVLNTANAMELAPIMSGEYEADAILWMGTAGSRGFSSLGKILCGQVNPSGRLADIYPTDFTKDPTYANFGAYSYTNSDVTDTSRVGNQGTVPRKFVEYEEGIYVGYRYYETADVVDESFVYGELDGKGAVSVEGAVAYPFGYGLSYTAFEQRITGFDDKGDTVTITVAVKNTGDVAGKDVVQIYYNPPYTDYDKENRIEKAAANLIGFAKTSLLAPGKSETVAISFAKEDMASYSYTHANSDSTTGCYLLEEGDYSIELKNNSHDLIDAKTVSIAKTVFYEGNNARNTEKEAQSALNENGEAVLLGNDYHAAGNQFDTLNAYMQTDGVTNLSRVDWAGTQPTMPDNREKEAPQLALDEFDRMANYSPDSDILLGNGEDSLVYTAEPVVSGAAGGLTLIDLRGIPYDDEKWDLLLDEIDWSRDQAEIQELLYVAAFQTRPLSALGKPSTVDKDGAMGWSTDGVSCWASANLIACTWNVDLLYEMGKCIGEEGLQSGIHGWYAPAINAHRSPFAGRNYEYYSEDGFLAGKLAAAAVSGAGDKGVFTYIKHMVLNDQETYRALFLATWATEQAVREIYLKPFEICIKEARSTLSYISDSEGTRSEKIIRSSTGVMSSQNCIGGIIGFAHYGLLTGVLRNEWGFAGAVVTDLYPSTMTTMRDMSIRAGTDMFMNTNGTYAVDYDSNTSRSVMRNAIHNIGYMTVNSNAVNGVTPGSAFSYGMSPWKWLQYGIMALLTLLSALLVVIMIRRTRKNSTARQ